MQPHRLLGWFAVLTVILAGAAIGRIAGLSSGEGIYLTALVLAVMGWIAGRRVRRRKDCP